MKNRGTYELMKVALSAFIEELIQSESGPSEEDIKYIRAEQERNDEQLDPKDNRDVGQSSAGLLRMLRRRRWEPALR